MIIVGTFELRIFCEFDTFGLLAVQRNNSGPVLGYLVPLPLELFSRLKQTVHQLNFLQQAATNQSLH